jgi:phenylpropionate dioxygenase-like ring-hydroxylating dioxygenase large terminal subunit
MLDDPVLINDWHPVCRANAVVAGGVAAARLLGEDLVLWRPQDSAEPVQVWRDLCIHRGARLSLGKVNQRGLACPYHGWVYDSTARCVHIPAHPEQTPPAKAKAQPYRAQERYGLIWVTLGDPAHDIPHFPEEGQAGYQFVTCGPFGPVHAGAPRIIENFLDVTHFPFVHGGILGDVGKPEISDYTVELGPDGLVANDVAVYQPDPYGTGEGDTVSYTYRVLRPFTAYLAKTTPRGTRMSILFPLTPHDETLTTAWFYIAMDVNAGLSDADINDFNSAILAQDVPIVESQRPELLPLDLQAELHLRSDRSALAYRRWLGELGVSFGTA